jgi:hypothetical protein
LTSVNLVMVGAAAGSAAEALIVPSRQLAGNTSAFQSARALRFIKLVICPPPSG